MNIQTNIIAQGKIRVNSGEALTSYTGRLVAGVEQSLKSYFRLLLIRTVTSSLMMVRPWIRILK